MSIRRSLLVVGALLPALAACGGGAPGGPSTPASPPASAPPATGASAYPQHDTPLSQAPPAIAAAWRPLDATVVPAASSIDGGPSVDVVDASGGAVAPAVVSSAGAAFVRTQRLDAWAGATDQPGLMAHVFESQFLLGKLGTALARGTRIHFDSCALYPVGPLVVLPLTAPQQAELARFQAYDPGSFALRAAYAPCQVHGTGPDGRDSVVDSIPAQTLLFVVSLHDDPVLGRFLYFELGFSCDNPTVAATCASA